MPEGGKSQAFALFPNPTIRSLLRKQLVRNDRGNVECWREASPSQKVKLRAFCSFPQTSECQTSKTSGKTIPTCEVMGHC